MKTFPVSLATENKVADDWLAWLRNYNAWKKPRLLSKEEFLALRDAIINPEKGYERVAQEFFYETLKPMVKGVAYQVLQTYKVVVSPLDLSTTIYRELWSEGNFTRLKGYLGDCSLFGWIAKIAAQIVYGDLEKLGLIRKNCQKTAKNTSLRLKSIANKDELMAILDLVAEPRWHDVLTEIYVKRTPFEEIMVKFDMDDTTLRKTIKVAECTLKEQLIATGSLLWHRPDTMKGEKMVPINLVSIALGDVSGNIDTTSSDDALLNFINKPHDTDIYEEIQEVLQVEYPGMNPESMWNHFVKDQALACSMPDEQLAVWVARYIEHESPVSIAERLGMRRSNVDNLFSRANKLLGKHIREWWQIHSN